MLTVATKTVLVARSALNCNDTICQPWQNAGAQITHAWKHFSPHTFLSVTHRVTFSRADVPFGTLRSFVPPTHASKSRPLRAWPPRAASLSLEGKPHGRACASRRRVGAGEDGRPAVPWTSRHSRRCDVRFLSLRAQKQMDVR